MNNVFILNPAVSLSDLQDAIDERITKLKATTACLLAADESSVTYELVHDTIWAIDGLIEELDILCRCLTPRLLNLNKRKSS